MTQHNFAKYLLFIALGHLAVGFALFHQTIFEIVNLGWVNVIGPDFLLGSAAAWFMLFSYPLFMIIASFWRQQALVTHKFVWISLCGSLVGVSLMPQSGFWLMLVLSLVALKNSKGSATPSAL